METFLKGKRIFVTGACGTIGKELIHQLIAEHDVGELVGIDNNESELFFLEQEFSQHPHTKFFLADIRDRDKLTRLMKHIQIVFHTAAYKHVILCERSPFEAVQTNIIGLQNLITSASDNQVERIIFTSSDKAVNPTNVMGTSKLMGERLITAANSNIRKSRQIFASTRFGNVLGSRGSVVPVFREQIKNGGPVTVTDEKMTRFIMSIKQAVEFVIDSSVLACGGEIFITKLPVIKILDLAEVMIETLAPVYDRKPEDIEIKIIGTKPGEKMYEELMNHEETRRTWEIDRYFVVIPTYGSLYRNIKYKYENIISTEVAAPYHSGSENPLSRKELLAYLKDIKLLDEDRDDRHGPAERYWP